MPDRGDGDGAVVGVVVPTRNRPALLAQTLHGIASQEVPVEIVVVDEGSAHETVAMLESLRRHLPITVVRHDRPRGLPAARNAGLARVAAPWVGFCDDDDVWAPAKLRAQLEAMAAAGADWACTGAIVTDADLRPVGFKRLASAAGIGAELRRGNVIPGGGSAVIARTEMVRRLGGFDESLRSSEDWDMWLRLADRGAFAVVDRPLVAYRVTPGSMSTNVGVMRASRTAVLAAAGGAPEPEDDLDYERFLAKQLTRAGRRGAAALAFASSAVRHRRPLLLGRAAFALAVPSALVRAGDRRWLREVPPTWLDEARSWLAQVPRDGREAWWTRTAASTT